MPFVPYALLHTLSGSHVSGVNVVAFSSCGRYLASGSDDKSIIIWDPISGKSLQRIFVKDEVLSLIWHPRNCALYFGCQDGTIIVIEDFSPEEENSGCEVLTGITASVDALDVDAESNYLAIGVGSEVQVSKKITQYTYATFVIMPSPPKLVPEEKTGGDKRIRPRSVHFLPGGSKLIVSYLNHGVVCWDVMTREKVWTITPAHQHRHIGFSAISPDLRRLLVYNLKDGMDIYEFGDNIPRRSFKQTPDADRNYPTMTSFLNGGKSVICGSQGGDVRIWDTATGIHQQTLSHNDCIVQAVCVHQAESYSLIASATTRTDADTHIRIWRASTDRERPGRWQPWITAAFHRCSGLPDYIWALGMICLMIASTIHFRQPVGDLLIRIMGIGSQIVAILFQAFGTICSATRELFAALWSLAKPLLKRWLRNLLQEDVT